MLRSVVIAAAATIGVFVASMATAAHVEFAGMADYTGECPAKLELTLQWTSKGPKDDASYRLIGPVHIDEKFYRNPIREEDRDPENPNRYYREAVHAWYPKWSGSYGAKVEFQRNQGEYVLSPVVNVNCTTGGTEPPPDWSEAGNAVNDDRAEATIEFEGGGEVEEGNTEIVFDDVETTNVISDEELDEQNEPLPNNFGLAVANAPVLKTVKYKCPAEVELGSVWESETGWSSSWEKVSAPFAASTIQKSEMICMYQKNRLLVPLKQPIPHYANSCRADKRIFTCTDSRK